MSRLADIGRLRREFRRNERNRAAHLRELESKVEERSTPGVRTAHHKASGRDIRCDACCLPDQLFDPILQRVNGGPVKATINTFFVGDQHPPATFQKCRNW